MVVLFDIKYLHENNMLLINHSFLKSDEYLLSDGIVKKWMTFWLEHASSGTFSIYHPRHFAIYINALIWSAMNKGWFFID